MMANDNENTVIMTIILIENNVETEEKWYSDMANNN
jgi:hypothetical protein